jgi:hypothetical protein
MGFVVASGAQTKAANSTDNQGEDDMDATPHLACFQKRRPCYILVAVSIGRIAVPSTKAQLSH